MFSHLSLLSLNNLYDIYRNIFMFHLQTKKKSDFLIFLSHFRFQRFMMMKLEAWEPAKMPMEQDRQLWRIVLSREKDNEETQIGQTNSSFSKGMK